MKHFVIFLFIVFILAEIFYVNSVNSSSQNYLTKMDSVLVSKINSDENVRVIVWINKTKFNTVDNYTLSSIGEIKNEFSIISAVAMEISSSELKILVQQDYVKKIEPVLEVRAFLQDSMPLINATKVWPQQISQTNITGRNVAVCILDTGVNYTHSDLGGCFGSGCRVVDGYDYVNNDTNPMDDNGHGTHVAGIIAANGDIRGVAPNASIIAIKILNSAGSGTTDNLISGIEWCVNNRTVYNISVISMSLGTNILFSTYCDNESGLGGVRDAINVAVEKNITVVAATGNDGNTTAIAAPACIQNTTAVAWSTKTDTVSSNSNRNSITDLIAPGSSINSTRLSPSSCLGGCSCSGNYMICSGTSMATPHVAGTLALLYQKYRAINSSDPTPSYLQQILNNTGKVISDSGGSNLNFMRIDVYSASLQINENEYPKWSNQNSNVTLLTINQSILLSAYWTDNTALANAVLSTNETGNWKNISTLSLSGLAAWSNFTWSNTSLRNGTVVIWKIYANDTSGNQNVTNILNFTVVDSESPQWFNQNPNTTILNSSSSILLSTYWTDNVELSHAILSMNDTGSWQNKSTTNLSSNAQWSNFTWSNSSITNGTYIEWKIYANDTSNNWNVTNVSNFTVIDTIKPNITDYKIIVRGELPTTENVVYISPQSSLSIKDSIKINVTSSELVKFKVRIYNSSWSKQFWYTTTFQTNLLRPSNCYWNGTINECDTDNGFLTEGSYKINVTLIDEANNAFNDTSKNITIDNTLPNVENISVIPNGTVTPGSNVSIQADIFETNLNTITAHIYNSSGYSTSITLNLSSGNTYKNNWTTSNLRNGTYYIDINSTDLAGNSKLIKTVAIIVLTTSSKVYLNNSVTTLANQITKIDTNVSSSTNVTLGIVANSTVNGSISIVEYNSTDKTVSGFGSLNKFIEIDVSNSISENLSWSWLNITYTDSEISSAGLNESTLRIWFYNDTANSWQQESNSSIDTVSNYVWSNITHFSLFAPGGLLLNGQSCNSNSECSSNNCASDYDGSGKWCAPSNNCAHDNTITYTSGSTTCYGSYKKTCSSGSWSSEYCSNGCSSGACVSASSGTTATAGGGGGGVSDLTTTTTAITTTPITTTTITPQTTTTTLVPTTTTIEPTLNETKVPTGFAGLGVETNLIIVAITVSLTIGIYFLYKEGKIFKKIKRKKK